MATSEMRIPGRDAERHVEQEDGVDYPHEPSASGGGHQAPGGADDPIPVQCEVDQDRKAKGETEPLVDIQTRKAEGERHPESQEERGVKEQIDFGPGRDHGTSDTPVGRVRRR